MTNRVWVMGDAVVDLIPEGEQHYLKCPGGAPANVAVGVARLGGESAFIGRVGADPFGRFMGETLAREGVDIRHLIQDPAHRTSTVLVDLDEAGEAQFHLHGAPERRSVLRAPPICRSSRPGSGC